MTSCWPISASAGPMWTGRQGFPSPPTRPRRLNTGPLCASAMNPPGAPAGVLIEPLVIGRKIRRPIQPCPRSRLMQAVLRISPVAQDCLFSLSAARYPIDRIEQVIRGIAGPGAATQHIIDPLTAAVGEVAIDAATTLCAPHHLAQEILDTDRARLRPRRIG